MKVLIADDEPMSLRILQAQLTRAGFEVVTASDGVAAINVLAAPDAPQLAIMDWMMPRASGPEVCRWIRGQKGGRYTYIILVTARDSQQDLIEALDCGCDDYVRKPYDPTELRARLRVGERIVNLEATPRGQGERARGSRSARQGPSRTHPNLHALQAYPQ